LAKKGEKYECGTCGVVMVVDSPCSCGSCDLICCGAPMKPVKAATSAKAKPSKTVKKK
jgi:hypothetical protein